MRVVLAGYRVVFNEKARAFDRAAVDADAESRRKVRTLAGNYQILWLEPRLLLPWRNPVWLQYVSHKLGRLAVPYALRRRSSARASPLASTHRHLSGDARRRRSLFYLLAGVRRGSRVHEPRRRAHRRGRRSRGVRVDGARRERSSRNGGRVAQVARVAFTFVMMNYAAVAGLFAAARGRRVWR